MMLAPEAMWMGTLRRNMSRGTMIVPPPIPSIAPNTPEPREIRKA
jgi:hypothetical protein